MSTCPCHPSHPAEYDDPVVADDERQVDYEYDDIYRLTREIITEGSAPGPTTTIYSYFYDDVGNRTRMTRSCSGSPGLLEVEYDYDAMDRLLSEIRTQQMAAGPYLDDGTRLARAHAPPRPSPRARWRLLACTVPSALALLLPLGLLMLPERLGRRRFRRRLRLMCAVWFFIPLMAVGPEAVLAAHHEALLYQALSAAGHATGGSPGVTTLTYSYDNNGNTIARSDGTKTNTYVYDFDNRLILADIQLADGSSPTGAVTYAYDADGIRKSKSADGAYLRYLTDKNRPYAQVLEERDGDSGTLNVRYTYGDDLISQTRDDDTWYYHYDGQMSTRQLTTGDTPAAVSNTYTFDAFGNLLDSTVVTEGPSANNYLYTGEQFDPNVGFYYLRARYYSPAPGRFLQRDYFDGLSWDPITLHRYLYANANPVDLRDPSGFISISNIILAITIRVTIFVLRHPFLAGAIGFVFNLLLPEQIHEMMIASGIPGFTGLGAVGQGRARVFRLLANKRISNWFSRLPSSSGRLWRERGIAFENFLAQHLFPGARRPVPIAGNGAIDFMWRGRLIEAKTTRSILTKEGRLQLQRAAAEAADQTWNLVYVFVERPTKGTIEAIEKAGGSVIYLFDAP